MPIEYTFCFICREQCLRNNSSRIIYWFVRFFYVFFSIISLWRPMTLRGVAALDPRGMIGRIYEGYH